MEYAAQGQRRLLRKPAVLGIKGGSNSGLYEEIKAEVWVEPVAIGPRAVAWPSDEVDALVSARIAGASNDQMRALVRRLHERRKLAAEVLLVEAL